MDIVCINGTQDIYIGQGFEKNGTSRMGIYMKKIYCKELSNATMKTIKLKHLQSTRQRLESDKSVTAV